MDRDDLILRAIANGATSPAALEARTGLTHASVWRGLQQLRASGHVFSPARSVVRLTALGETALSVSGQVPALPPPAEAALVGEPRSSAAMDHRVFSVPPPQPVGRDADTHHHDADPEAHPGVAGLAALAGRFGWGEVVALLLVSTGVLVVAVLAARGSAGAPPIPPDAPPPPAAFIPPWYYWP